MESKGSFPDPPPYTDQQPAGYPHPTGYPQPTGQPQPGVYPHLEMTPPVVVASAPPMVVAQTILVQQMGPRPTTTVCKSCNQQVETRVEYEPTTKTHLIALALCLVGCCLCACIPYCVDSCRTANHYCPRCNAYIGCYNN